jgi:hypothetical protein
MGFSLTVRVERSRDTLVYGFSTSLEANGKVGI